jgi:hypothetical protein
MKKVFKASLVAASMAVAFSASAAQIISTPLKLSAEGIQAGVAGVTTTFANFNFDVKVDQLHPSGSEIVLTFTDGLDLAGVTPGVCIAPVAGVTTCGDLQFNVGNGNFTFDNVAVDDEEGTVTFNVQLGNAITAQSAFRVAIANASLEGAVTATYASSIGGTAIESTTKALTETVTQFSYAVKTKLDQVIERPITRLNFKDSTTADTLVLTVRNNTDLLLAATAGATTLELTGNFKDGNAADWEVDVGAGFAGAVSGASDNLLTFTVPAADMFGGVATATDVDVNFAKAVPADKLLATGFALTVKQAITGIATAPTYVTAADAGKWSIDAAVINVPYLPVGYSQFSGNVEVANLSGADAEVIVEAVGKTGVKYGPVVLAKKAAKGAVTTVFEGDLMSAFGLAKGDNEKLSVTFSIDADINDITLAPYYREGSARINVISDQYKK